MTPSAYEPTHPTALAADAEAPPPSATATATFGMGCFWGPDARFGATPGVVRTRVGYAGGTEPDPSYYSLGDHTEVVQVEYNPDTVSYEALLDVFWANHAPFSAPLKRQYRGVVLAHDDQQCEAAKRTRDDLESRTGKAVETAIETLDQFYLAEDYHQKYRLRSASFFMSAFEEASYSDEDLRESPFAATLNGYVAGHSVSVDADLPAPSQRPR